MYIYICIYRRQPMPPKVSSTSQRSFKSCTYTYIRIALKQSNESISSAMTHTRSPPDIIYIHTYLPIHRYTHTYIYTHTHTQREREMKRDGMRPGLLCGAPGDSSVSAADSRGRYLCSYPALRSACPTTVNSPAHIHSRSRPRHLRPASRAASR